VGTATLSFWLRMVTSGVVRTTDYLEVTIDGSTIFKVTGGEAVNYSNYTHIPIDVSTYADGGAHTITFHTISNGFDGLLNCHLDDVELVER
jgi:hypothetical protein